MFSPFHLIIPISKFEETNLFHALGSRSADGMDFSGKREELNVGFLWSGPRLEVWWVEPIHFTLRPHDSDV